MDLSCNKEEKEMSYVRHASEKLSKMPEALGVVDLSFTRSRMIFSIVDRTICFGVRETPKLNHQLEDGPLSSAEHKPPAPGVSSGFLLLDAEGDVIPGFEVFSSR
jgi:hypothetical protein